MEQNIRELFSNKEYKGMLGGIVEVDEMYAVRDTTKKTKRGRGTNKCKIFGMRERNSEENKIGEFRIKVVSATNSRTLHPIIFENVEAGSWLMSDDYKAYRNLEEFYVRGVSNHSKRHYADGEVHINSVEGSWSHLRRLINGIHHRPSKKHLQKYLDEFEFRYNHRDKSLNLIFKAAIKQSKVRKTHAELTRKQ